MRYPYIFRCTKLRCFRSRGGACRRPWCTLGTPCMTSVPKPGDRRGPGRPAMRLPDGWFQNVRPPGRGLEAVEAFVERADQTGPVLRAAQVGTVAAGGVRLVPGDPVRPGPGAAGRVADPGLLEYGDEWGLSAACPAVGTIASGRHLRSAARWTLLVCPPRERPSRGPSAGVCRRRIRRSSSWAGPRSADRPACPSASPLFCRAFSSSAAAFPRAVRTLSSRCIPAASWWARAVVESTPTRDTSVSPRLAASAIRPSSRASKTPPSRHCRKRLWTVGQGPNSAGISRHCPPVLNCRITPSNCCRSRSGESRRLITTRTRPN